MSLKSFETEQRRRCDSLGLCSQPGRYSGFADSGSSRGFSNYFRKFCFDSLFALLIAAVVVTTTLRAVIGSHKELLWPENYLAATLAVKKARDEDCCSDFQI